MRPALLALLLPCLLATGCERRTEEPGDAAAPTNAPAATSSDRTAPATSIIRPEVAEEIAPPIVIPPPIPVPRLAIVPFGDGGAALDAEARAVIDAVMAEPGFATGGAITVSGHSDASGSDGDNLVVSRRRAEAVRRYMLSKGADEDRITVVALGERRPIEPNANPDGSDYLEGRQKNRRVEIVIDPPPGPASGGTGPAATDDQPRPATANRPRTDVE